MPGFVFAERLQNFHARSGCITCVTRERIHLHQRHGHDDMNTAIAIKFASIIASVQAGADIVVAFEAQFGAGSYEKLAGMLHDQLNGK